MIMWTEYAMNDNELKLEDRAREWMKKHWWTVQGGLLFLAIGCGAVALIFTFKGNWPLSIGLWIVAILAWKVGAL